MILPFLLALTAAAPLPAPAAPPVAAPARTAPDVDARETRYQAWVLRCETLRTAKPPRTLCGLVSTVSVKKEGGQPTIVTRIMLRPTQAGQGYQMAFELPLGVLLQPGAQVADGAGKPIVRLPFVACRPTSCEAGAVLTDEQTARLRAATDKAMVFYDLQNGQTMKLEYSMAGFTAALDALKAQAAR